MPILPDCPVLLPLAAWTGQWPGTVRYSGGGQFFLYYFPLKVIYCIYTSLLIPTASYVIFDGVGQFLQGLPNTFFLNKHKHNKKVDINFDHQ